MANDTLYNDAASLLQGATGGEADAGKTYSNIADTKIKDATLAQGSQIDREKTAADAQGRSADNAAEMEREKLKEKGATDRTSIQQAGETKRQFTTMTPELIRGLDAADPKGGWGKNLKPGQTMQTDVMLGLLTARLKHDSIKSGTTDVMIDGVPTKMGYSFDPENGFKIQPLGGSLPKGEGKGGSRPLTEKDLRSAVDRETKAINDEVSKGALGAGMVKDFFTSNKVLDAKKGVVRQSAKILKDSLAKLKEMGADVTVDPQVLKIANEVDGEGSGWTDEKEKRLQELKAKHGS